MRNKRLVTLCIAAISFIGLYAQEITEINIEKPGKLMKQIKKEINTITRLKLSGSLNHEDFFTLAEIPNLEYLDLRDVSLDVSNKKYSFRSADALNTLDEVLRPLYKLGPYKSLKELHLPYNLKNVSGIEAPVLERLYTPIIDNIFDNNSFGTKTAYIDKIAGEISGGLGMYNADSVVFVGCTPTKELLERLSPCVIYLKDNNTTLVHRWEGPITSEIIKTFDFIFPGAFKKNPYVKQIKSIELSDKLVEVPEDLFSGFSNLKEVKFGNSLECIKAGAFSDTAIEEIDVPSTVTTVERYAFKNAPLKKITLHTTTPPNWLRTVDENAKSAVYIPDGTFLAYQKKYYDNNTKNFLFVDNKKYGSYTISVPKGNSILSYISLDDLICCDSLTISGVLYEQDFNYINKAQRLKYLDISKCFTSYSEEFLEEYRQKMNAMSAIFQVISESLDDQYNDNQMGTFDYKVNKAIADEISKAYSTGKLENEKCIIPHEALMLMPALEHLKLPILCAGIGPNAFSACKKLKKVELPPYLINISTEAFAYCHNLKDIHFPQSLKVIDRQAFYNCLSFEKIDLSNLELNHLEDQAFAACTSLTELIFPEGLKEISDQTFKNYQLNKIVFPSTATKVSMRNRDWGEDKAVPCEFHFKSQTPPQGDLRKYIFGDGATIFIPKGTTTVYTTKFGTGLKYVEE